MRGETLYCQYKQYGLLGMQHSAVRLYALHRCTPKLVEAPKSRNGSEDMGSTSSLDRIYIGFYHFVERSLRYPCSCLASNLITSWSTAVAIPLQHSQPPSNVIIIFSCMTHSFFTCECLPPTGSAILAYQLTYYGTHSFTIVSSQLWEGKFLAVFNRFDTFLMLFSTFLQILKYEMHQNHIDGWC